MFWLYVGFGGERQFPFTSIGVSLPRNEEFFVKLLEYIKYMHIHASTSSTFREHDAKVSRFKLARVLFATC